MHISAVLEGQKPSNRLEFDLSGVVVKDGWIEYSFDGMIGYHHNVVDYFRACVEAGKLKVAHSVYSPLDATVLHQLFSLSGRTASSVGLYAYRKGPTLEQKYAAIYASMHLTEVKIASVSPIKSDGGTSFYLVNFQARPGNGTVTWG